MTVNWHNTIVTRCLTDQKHFGRTIETVFTRHRESHRLPHAIGPMVGEFLAQAFGIQVNHRPLQLRGVYYTSATQEGNPIDRVMVALARTFKLERGAAAVKPGTGKSFFLTRLLHEVVFSEAGLAKLDPPGPT